MDEQETGYQVMSLLVHRSEAPVTLHCYIYLPVLLPCDSSFALLG